MAQTFLIWIIKGGAGKSTIAKELAVKLATRGKRGLLVDLDQQADLTKSFGYQATREALQYTSYDILLNPDRNPRDYAVIETPFGLDLIPATRELRGAESELAQEFGRELKLRQALDHLKGDYDFIFLDPPPGVGILVANALVASDNVLVPLEVRPQAWDKLPEMEDLIKKVRAVNPHIKLNGIITTKTDNTSISKEIERRAREQYGELVFRTRIPTSVRLAEAFAARQPIGLYSNGSPGDISFNFLAEELEERYGL